MRVVIVGASPRPDRTANQALHRLKAHGHDVALVNPRYTVIDGLACLATLQQVAGPVDTVTVYVNAAHSLGMEADIRACQPRRVIFNPGSENRELAHRLRASGIEVEEACTLVLLGTGAF